MAAILEVKNLTKAFSGVTILHNVDFSVGEGEVVALVGANGAGKSTLLKCITGVNKIDEGELKLFGKDVHFTHTSQAKEMGISMIYQELTVIPNLTVAENIFLSQACSQGVIPYKKMCQRAEKLLEEMELTFKATDLAGTLSVANQQMIEIARAINAQSKILILDEPTSALTEREKDCLFDIIRKLRAQGMGLVFVSHRMKEIFEICDRVTVLRDGRLIGNYEISDLDEERIVNLMMGEGLSNFFPKVDVDIGDVVLKVEHLQWGTAVKDVSFELRKGEILGLTGLMGAGRTETAQCLFGIHSPTGGRVEYMGRELHYRSPRDAIGDGIFLVPEDRKGHGLILEMDIMNNVSIGTKVIRPIRDIRKERRVAEEYVSSLRIKCNGIKQKTRNLSGGNQQKVVLANSLIRDVDVLILDEPTRGIDVVAKSEVHALIGEMVKKGVSVILISSEFEEIMGICDRTIVLYEGETQGELPRNEFSEEAILTLAHGKKLRKHSLERF